MVVSKVEKEDPRFVVPPPIPLEKRYPLQARIIYLGPKFYGSNGKIVKHLPTEKDPSLIQLVLSLNKPPRKIDLDNILNFDESSQLLYQNSNEIARTLNIPHIVLSKITAPFFVKDGGTKYNLGLNIKLQKQNQKVMNYSRRPDISSDSSESLGGWEFSSKAVTLISSYLQEFPFLFEFLERDSGKGMCLLSDLGISSEELQELVEWRKRNGVEEYILLHLFFSFFSEINKINYNNEINSIKDLSLLMLILLDLMHKKSKKLKNYLIQKSKKQRKVIVKILKQQKTRLLETFHQSLSWFLPV